jgi:hypothetical protein
VALVELDHGDLAVPVVVQRLELVLEAGLDGLAGLRGVVLVEVLAELGLGDLAVAVAAAQVPRTSDVRRAWSG